MPRMKMAANTTAQPRLLAPKKTNLKGQQYPEVGALQDVQNF